MQYLQYFVLCNSQDRAISNVAALSPYLQLEQPVLPCSRAGPLHGWMQGFGTFLHPVSLADTTLMSAATAKCVILPFESKYA